MILRIIKWYLHKYTDYELTVGSKPLKRFDKIFENTIRYEPLTYNKLENLINVITFEKVMSDVKKKDSEFFNKMLYNE